MRLKCPNNVPSPDHGGGGGKRGAKCGLSFSIIFNYKSVKSDNNKRWINKSFNFKPPPLSLLELSLPPRLLLFALLAFAGVAGHNGSENESTNDDGSGGGVPVVAIQLPPPNKSSPYHYTDDPNSGFEFQTDFSRIIMPFSSSSSGSSGSEPGGGPWGYYSNNDNYHGNDHRDSFFDFRDDDYDHYKAPSNSIKDQDSAYTAHHNFHHHHQNDIDINNDYLYNNHNNYSKSQHNRGKWKKHKNKKKQEFHDSSIDEDVLHPDFYDDDDDGEDEDIDVNSYQHFESKKLKQKKYSKNNKQQDHIRERDLKNNKNRMKNNRTMNKAKNSIPGSSLEDISLSLSYDNGADTEDDDDGGGDENNNMSKSRNRRPRRSVVHLYDMVVCATGCNPLAYKGYGCYCGFLGSGITVDGIDRCCAKHDWCYHHAKCPPLLTYFVPYYWTCNNGRPRCVTDYRGWKGICGANLCECDRQFAECLRRFPCPRSRAMCMTSPWRFWQNLLMVPSSMRYPTYPSYY